MSGAEETGDEAGNARRDRIDIIRRHDCDVSQNDPTWSVRNTQSGRIRNRRRPSIMFHFCILTFLVLTPSLTLPLGVAALFADAELAEDTVEDVVRVNHAENSAQMIESLAHIDGD